MSAACGSPCHYHPERLAFRVARAVIRLANARGGAIGRKRVMNLRRAMRIQDALAIRAEDYCYGG